MGPRNHRMSRLVAAVGLLLAALIWAIGSGNGHPEGAGTRPSPDVESGLADREVLLEPGLAAVGAEAGREETLRPAAAERTKETAETRSTAQTLRGRFSGYPPYEAERWAELRLLDNVTDSIATRRRVRFDEAWELPVEYTGAYTLFAVTLEQPFRTTSPMHVYVEERPDPEPVDVPLLPAAGFEGRVLSMDGAPVRNARVLVRGDGYSRARATTDDDGRFSVHLGLGGGYDLMVSAIGFVSTRDTFHLAAHELRHADVLIRRAARVGGTAVRQGGRLKKGTIRDARFRGGSRGDIGASGEFELFMRRRSAITLAAHAVDDEGRHYVALHGLRVEDSHEDVGVLLQPAASVFGTLRTAEGDPAPAVWVNLTSPIYGGVRHVAETAADGSFRVPFVYLGEYDVTVSGSDDVIARCEAFYSDERVRLDLRMR